MGGNAFNAILPSASFPRLPPPVYYTLKARLTPVLRTIFSFVETPAEAPEKQDYGDLDFTVCSPAAGISIVTSQSDGEATVSHEVLREALHAEHVIPMPGYRTSSYAVPIQRSEWSDLGFASLYDQYLEDATAEGGPRLFYQIDVHLSADEGEARRIVFFNSYGDLGMIMGLLAANNGLQFGSQGLKMPNGIWKRVLLTSDMSRAMAFMGLDKDVRERGFETKGQIFKWITNSRFFVDAPQFKLKGAGISKVKPTRSMYAEFVEWVEKITGENPEGSVEAEDIGNVIRNEFVARRRQEALVHFGLKEEYDEEMRQITLRAKVKSMFNGTVVRDWLGIHGNNNWPLVNRVMAVVRENLGGADGVARVVEAEGEQGIEREVMQAFRVVQQRTGVGPFWPAFASRRSFSCSARIHRHISHIGASPIPFSSNVTLLPSAKELVIKGPLGETSIPLRPYMSISFPQNTKTDSSLVALAVENGEIKEQRAMWGTTRTLIANAITGMTEGFSVNLYLVGVGYRVAIEQDPRGTVDGNSGSRLNMKLGYSHSVFVPIPPWIKAEVPSATKIMLSCTDKQKLGLFAALVKSYRKPEPYKGKGIFIDRETIGIKKVRKK